MPCAGRGEGDHSQRGAHRDGSPRRCHLEVTTTAVPHDRLKSAALLPPIPRGVFSRDGISSVLPAIVPELAEEGAEAGAGEGAGGRRGRL